ncbi:MAG: hypothetical protein KQI35_10400 [Bacteroidetes bacterium]|nr:hypothetical protein [Bacteroidota bacterium]
MTSKKEIYDPNVEFELIPDELKKIPKGEPFSVPSNYFDSLPEIIQGRVSAMEQKPVRFWHIKRKIAASFISIVAVVILITSYLLWFDKNGSNDSELFSEITLDEMLVLYPNFFQDIDEDALIEVLVSSETSNSMTESGIIFDTTLTDEDIIRYLEEEDISTEQIVNL